MNKVNIFFNLAVLLLNAPLLKLHFISFKSLNNHSSWNYTFTSRACTKKLISDGVNPYKTGC